ncbi:MAG: TIGR02466 family protein [Myxococcota bacterium]
MSSRPDAPELAWLWPTPLLRRRFPGSEALNADLARTFLRFRDKQIAREKAAAGPVYASPDDLLKRFQKKALRDLFAFIGDAVFELARAANEHAWKGMEAPQLRVAIAGAWFQIQNGYGSHGVHSHGNCSWSGVYYVQSDPEPVRRAHATLGEQNGVLRFHGPRFERLAGAHQDLGNLYLQDSALDVAPEPGGLVVFPSWLPHEALPYDGTLDRIAISFNAVLEGAVRGAAPGYGF